MVNRFGILCRQWWLTLVIILLAMLSSWTSFTADAQQAPTSTPDVNTVPPVERLYTPTPTSPPVQVPIVTATAIVGSPTPLPNNAGSGTSGESSGQIENSQDSSQGSSLPIPVANPTTLLPTAISESPLQTAGTRIDAPDLTLTMLPNRGFVWQNQTLRLYMELHNQGQQTAIEVALRSDLTPNLRLLAITATDPATGKTQSHDKFKTRENVLLAQWTAIEPGTSIGLTLDLFVEPVTPNGRIIDIFAIVTAENASDVVSGISIVMPPARPPRF